MCFVGPPSQSPAAHRRHLGASRCIGEVRAPIYQGKPHCLLAVCCLEGDRPLMMHSSMQAPLKYLKESGPLICDLNGNRDGIDIYTAGNEPSAVVAADAAEADTAAAGGGATAVGLGRAAASCMPAASATASCVSPLGWQWASQALLLRGRSSSMSSRRDGFPFCCCYYCC